MNAWLRRLGQAAAYLAFAAAVGWLSARPAYAPIGPDQALVRLSFGHYGARLGECRRRSTEELSRLPPNMRATLECPRERSPIRVHRELDGRRVYEAVLDPSGLSRDGPAHVYEKFVVPAGEHRLRVFLDEDIRRPQGEYTAVARAELAPGEVLVVDFRPVRGGFVFYHHGKAFDGCNGTDCDRG